MSGLKSQLRMQAQHEIGARLDDQLEAAQRAFHAAEGARQALVMAHGSVEKLLPMVDADISAGAFDAVAEGGPLSVGGAVKRWLLRAIGSIDNLATAAEIQIHTSRGKVEAITGAVKMCSGLYEAEKARVERQESMDVGHGEAEPLLSAAADIEARRAEARASKAQSGEICVQDA